MKWKKKRLTRRKRESNELNTFILFNSRCLCVKRKTEDVKEVVVERRIDTASPSDDDTAIGFRKRQNGEKKGERRRWLE